jgi:O-antigen/teichoic acid export membrane protein
MTSQNRLPQSQRVVLNALSVLAKTFVLMAIGIILPPYVIGQIGRSEYGMVILISSFLAFMQMVQIGTPQALNRFIPRELERGDKDSLRSLLSTGIAMLCMCGVVVAIGTMLLAHHPEWIVNIPTETPTRNISILIIIMGLAASVDLPLSFGHVLFQAHERYMLHSILQTLGYLARLVLVLLLLGLFPGKVLAFAVGTVAGNFIQSLGIFVIAILIFREVRLAVRTINFGTMIKIGGFGLLTTVNTLAMMMFVQADYIVIGKLIGSEEVTAFNLGVVWVLIVRTYISAAMSVLTPSASRTETAGQPEILREMLIRSTKYGLLASLLPLLFLVPFGKVLMEVWMGPGYNQSSQIMLFVLLGDLFANGISGGISMLIGVGKLRFLTLANLAAGILNITIAVILMKTLNLGVMSFAYAYCGVFMILNSIVLPAHLGRIFGIPMKQYLKRAWLSPVLAGLLALPVGFLIYRMGLTRGWVGMLMSGALFSIGYAIIVLVIAFDKYDRQLLRRVLVIPGR